MMIRPFLLERYFVDREATYSGTTELISLSSADCEPLTQHQVLGYASSEQLRSWESLKLGYTDSYGLLKLRETIAKLYASVTTDDVISVEPTEGIFVVMNCLLESGDHVIANYPVYQPLYQVAESIGCGISYWKADPKGWQFDIEQLAALVKPETKLIVLNFPHNPTGTTLSVEQLYQVIELARQHDCYVFSDELFRWSEQDVADRLPAVCDIYEQGVTLSGLSKSFSLAGLRVGWLVTQDRSLIERFSIFKDYTTGCSSAPSELLALIALSARDQIIARTLKIINDNLDLVETFVSDHANTFHWYRPKTSLVTLMEYLGDDLELFANSLLADRGVLLAPGSVLGLDQVDNGHNYFRLGFGYQNLGCGLERLQAFLAAR